MQSAGSCSIEDIRFIAPFTSHIHILSGLLRTFDVPVHQVLPVHVVQSLECPPQDLSTSLPHQVCLCREHTVGLFSLLQLQDVVVDAASHLPNGSREVLCKQSKM